MKRYQVTGPMKWLDVHITDPERSDGECVGTVRGRGGVVVGRYLYRTATDTVEWDGDDSWRDPGCDKGPVTSFQVGSLWPVTRS